MYSEHDYNIPVHSFYYLKWRHLVNHIPLDNATLKIQHHGVGRRLSRRKRQELCLWNQRPWSQQSILVMRSFLAKVYCFRACKVRPLQVDAAARRRAVSHCQKQLTWKYHSSSRTWHCDHQTTNIWIRWNVLFGECFRRWFTTAEVSNLCNN